MERAQRARVVCVGGPTGVGKTRLLDRLFSGRGELISADSMQIYRGMDIGTAKPPAELRERLPHHLIDVVTPDQRFTVADFVRRADALVGEIASRGRIPIVSGGTAFYMRGYLLGVPQAPPADPQLRAELEARLASEGCETLHAELEQVDPESAAKLSRSDRYRIIRALELYYSTGKPRSAFPVPERIREEIDPLVIALYRDRQELYRGIDRRVGEMFARGLEAEVERLLAQGYSTRAPGLRAIGYREVAAALTGAAPAADTSSVTARAPREIDAMEKQALIRTVQRNSRRYAKRQLTFFRRLPRIEWFHADDEAGVRSRVEAFLHGEEGGGLTRARSNGYV